MQGALQSTGLVTQQTCGGLCAFGTHLGRVKKMYKWRDTG